MCPCHWSAGNLVTCSLVVAYKLATCIALHGLGLAVSCVMVWPTTFVAGGRARPPHKSTTESTPVTSTRRESSTASAYRRPSTECSWTAPLDSCKVSDECTAWVTILQSSTYSKMTRLAASVAATPGPCPADAQRRAIGLHMAKTLAMVTLFRCSCLSASVATSRDSEARIIWGHLLSVLRGSGHPLDSCPKPSVREIVENVRKARRILVRTRLFA